MKRLSTRQQTFFCATLVLFASSLASAGIVRAPRAVEEQAPEVPAVETVPAKVVKSNPRVKLAVPAERVAKPVKKPETNRQTAAPGSRPRVPVAPAAAQRRGCVATLNEYNSPSNAHIKAAVGGANVFTNWRQVGGAPTPLGSASIEIRRSGQAIVRAGETVVKEAPAKLCVDNQGPYLIFAGQRLRLPRGPLNRISLQFQGQTYVFSNGQRPTARTTTVSSR